MNRLVRLVMERSDYTCHYCGDTATQLLPIIPSILGGDTDDPDNLLAVCTSDLRTVEGILNRSILAVAGNHPEELARSFAIGVEGLGRRPIPGPAELPGQLSIEEVLS